MSSRCICNLQYRITSQFHSLFIFGLVWQKSAAGPSPLWRARKIRGGPLFSVFWYEPSLPRYSSVNKKMLIQNEERAEERAQEEGRRRVSGWRTDNITSSLLFWWKNFFNLPQHMVHHFPRFFEPVAMAIFPQLISRTFTDFHALLTLFSLTFDSVELFRCPKCLDRGFWGCLSQWWWSCSWFHALSHAFTHLHAPDGIIFWPHVWYIIFHDFSSPLQWWWSCSWFPALCPRPPAPAVGCG